MPTNEERREVARRLREADGLFGILADLIDPEPERTCHDVTPWGDFFTCSECNGQVMLRPDVRWPDDGKILRTPTLIDGEGLGMRYPRFCPNCGAKVVGE